jgi:hypothetical protein
MVLNFTGLCVNRPASLCYHNPLVKRVAFQKRVNRLLVHTENNTYFAKLRRYAFNGWRSGASLGR